VIGCQTAALIGQIFKFRSDFDAGSGFNRCSALKTIKLLIMQPDMIEKSEVNWILMQKQQRNEVVHVLTVSGKKLPVQEGTTSKNLKFCQWFQTFKHHCIGANMQKLFSHLYVTWQYVSKKVRSLKHSSKLKIASATETNC
jgi:hypothetical protein